MCKIQLNVIFFKFSLLLLFHYNDTKFLQFRVTYFLWLHSVAVHWPTHLQLDWCTQSAKHGTFAAKSGNYTNKLIKLYNFKFNFNVCWYVKFHGTFSVHIYRNADKRAIKPCSAFKLTETSLRRHSKPNLLTCYYEARDILLIARC